MSTLRGKEVERFQHPCIALLAVVERNDNPACGVYESMCVCDSTHRAARAASMITADMLISTCVLVVAVRCGEGSRKEGTL